ncbi:MAG: hypothetical protein R3A78_00235 [Polyangiales bacterium]
MSDASATTQSAPGVLGPWRALHLAAKLVWRDRGAELPLTLALLASFLTVWIGIGFVLAAWIGCELLRAQLRAALARPIERSAAWWQAGFLLSGAVVLIALVAWLTVLGLGAGMPVLDEPLVAPRFDARPVVGFAVVTLLALHFILPFGYAPFVLIERRGGVWNALAQSAAIVRREGYGRAYATTLVSHAVQFAPAIILGTIAAGFFGWTRVPLALLVASPAFILTVPVGQAMFTVRYAAAVVNEPEAAEIDFAHRAGPVACAAVLGFMLVPLAALALVTASLVRPSEPRPLIEAPVGEPMGELVGDGAIHVRDTALVVRLDGGAASVETLDGGGVGGLGVARVRALYVRRVRDAYAIGLRAADGQMREAWVDRAGVRIDDDLTARLTDHLRMWSAAAIAFYALLAPVMLTRVLTGTRRRGADARRWIARNLALLAPLAIAALAAGIRCLI